MFSSKQSKNDNGNNHNSEKAQKCASAWQIQCTLSARSVHVQCTLQCTFSALLGLSLIHI